MNTRFLKKHGYLENGWHRGGIKWTYGMSGNESSIGFTTDIGGDEGDYIRLDYTHTSRETGEKEEMDYRVQLASTPCNYGGRRYWFICPLTKNGQYCGRRVGVLFSIGKWFGCRHCGEIAYAAQMRGGKWRGSSITLPDLERMEGEIRRTHYAGKPTRKYLRYVRMNEKFEMDFMRIAGVLNGKYAKIAKKLR